METVNTLETRKAHPCYVLARLTDFGHESLISYPKRVRVRIRVITMISQSASKGLRQYTSLPVPEKRYKEPTITVKRSIVAITFLGSTVSKAVHIGLPKLVPHLINYVQVFGIEADLTQNWKSTKLWYFQHYLYHMHEKFDGLPPA